MRSCHCRAASPVNAENIDHTNADQPKVPLAPSLSATSPAGTFNTKYVQKNDERMTPIMRPSIFKSSMI